MVAIAIIGLIASLVLVAISGGGIQSQARIAKTLEFSQSVNNALGAYSAGSWGFDEGSGATARDGSGYGNNGTISGATYVTDTPHLAAGAGAGKYALSFDGVEDDYVNLGNPPSLRINGDLTIEFWMKPASLGLAEIFVQGTGTPNSNWEVQQGGSSLSFYWGNGATREAWDVPGTFFAVNTWVHVAITADYPQLRVYKNGKLMGTQNMPSDITNTDTVTPYRISGFTNGTRIADGIIDEVRVYGVALTLSEIQKLYAEGLRRHAEDG